MFSSNNLHFTSDSPRLISSFCEPQNKYVYNLFEGRLPYIWTYDFESQVSSQNDVDCLFNATLFADITKSAPKQLLFIYFRGLQSIWNI